MTDNSIERMNDTMFEQELKNTLLDIPTQQDVYDSIMMNIQHKTEQEKAEEEIKKQMIKKCIQDNIISALKHINTVLESCKNDIETECRISLTYKSCGYEEVSSLTFPTHNSVYIPGGREARTVVGIIMEELKKKGYTIEYLTRENTFDYENNHLIYNLVIHFN